MLKKLINIIFVILLVMLIKTTSVRALTIQNAGNGNYGELSAGCSGGRCGNTVGLTIDGKTFSNTAIYGMRVTIVDKNGNQKNNTQVLNFWATEDMRNAALHSSVNHTNTFGNITYTVRNNYLYNWANGGLHEIDASKKTYAQFIDDLKEEDINFIISSLGAKKEDVVNKNYFLKIQPIFVLHFGFDGTHYYFQGTVQEIYTMANNISYYNGNEHLGLAQYIMKQDGGTWNVLKNYYLTTYLNKREGPLSGSSIPIWTKSDASAFVVHGSENGGLSVGYVWLKDFAKNSNSITITKRTGFPSDVGNGKSTLEGYACFQLLKKNNGKYEEYLERKCVKNSQADDVLANHQVSFENLPVGQYKIREVGIDTNSIGKVSFRKRTDVVGQYINHWGEVTPSSGIADSNEFKVEANGKYYFVAYNQPKAKLSKIVITKRKGAIGTSTLEGYACFQLLRYDEASAKYGVYVVDGRTYMCNQDPKNSSDATKYQQVVINGIPEGKYLIREIYIDEDTEKVSFRQKNETDPDKKYNLDKGTNIVPILLNGDRVAASNSFDIGNQSKTYYFRVYNHPGDSTSNKYKVYVDKWFKYGDEDPTRNGTADFRLERYVNGKWEYVKTIRKKQNMGRIWFNNLSKGDYRVVEIDVLENVKSVDFEVQINAVTTKSYSADMNQASHEATSEVFTIDGINSIGLKITNHMDDTTVTHTCKNDLNNIKSFCNSADPASCIKRLWELYEDYSTDNYNKLFNYKISGGSLDISGVECATVSCGIESNSNFTCASGNAKLSPTDDSIESRVCYIGTSPYSGSFGNFYNEDLGAYCNVSFEYNTKFSENNSVLKGGILWQQVANSKVGSLTVNVVCDGVYSDEIDARQDLDPSKFLNDYLPKFNIFWKTKNGNKDKRYTQPLSIDNSVIDNFGKTSSDTVCVNGNCYSTWSSTYSLDFSYSWFWHTKGDSGVLYQKNKIINNDAYKFVGYGLPIALNQPVGNNYNAMLGISYYDASPWVECPYEVTDEPGPPDNPGNPDGITFKDELNFRIIDINNPFPGINGDNSRLVGDNWCVDSRIGTYTYDNDNNKIVIGDLKDNDEIITADEYQVNFADLINDLRADINGDDTVDNNDNSILFRYLKNSNRNLNCQSDPEKNNLVKKYITNAPTSNSTDAPMYSFTLTPGDIRLIREYNKSHAYSEFNLNCDGNGNYCLSKFLTNLINNKINIDGSNKSVSIVNRVNSSCYTNRSKNGVSISKKWCSNN